MAQQMSADTDTSTRSEPPRVIRVHPNDNVAIIANDFGLLSGTQLPSGPALRERVPQGHKVALVDIAERLAYPWHVSHRARHRGLPGISLAPRAGGG